jgi:glucoamylase
MLSEQVWDNADIADRELFFGKPSGSAMPLVWAHAEYVKLRRSLHDQRVFDTPPQTIERYQMKKTGSPFALWRFNHKCRFIARGKTLRIEVLAQATVHWSDDGWRTVHDTPANDRGLGVHCADLATKDIAAGRRVEFTFYWSGSDTWENTDFAVAMAEA